MKNLIEDIYKAIEPLSSGEPIDISTEEIDNTVADLREALIHWAKPNERNKKFSLRMSNIGRPSRQLWFENKNQNEITLSASNQIRFLYGHILEAIVIMFVRMAGYKVTDQQKEVNVDGISGHIDCKINGEVVDVKTASMLSFDKFSDIISSFRKSLLLI